MKTDNKTERKMPKNYLGYISKSKTGKTMLKVEQGVTLDAGDMLIISTPQENIQSLADNGVITQEQADERIEKVPDWKLYEVSRLPSKN